MPIGNIVSYHIPSIVNSVIGQSPPEGWEKDYFQSKGVSTATVVLSLPVKQKADCCHNAKLAISSACPIAGVNWSIDYSYNLKWLDAPTQSYSPEERSGSWLNK